MDIRDCPGGCKFDLNQLISLALHGKMRQ